MGMPNPSIFMQRWRLYLDDNIPGINQSHWENEHNVSSSAANKSCHELSSIPYVGLYVARISRHSSQEKIACASSECQSTLLQGQQRSFLGSRCQRPVATRYALCKPHTKSQGNVCQVWCCCHNAKAPQSKTLLYAPRNFTFVCLIYYRYSFFAFL